MKFTKKIKWKQFNGTETQITVSDCAALQEADKTATELAVQSGWTPPKWWHFHRWNDTGWKPSIIKLIIDGFCARIK